MNKSYLNTSYITKEKQKDNKVIDKVAIILSKFIWKIKVKLFVKAEIYAHQIIRTIILSDEKRNKFQHNKIKTIQLNSQRKLLEKRELIS